MFCFFFFFSFLLVNQVILRHSIYFFRGISPSQLTISCVVKCRAIGHYLHSARLNLVASRLHQNLDPGFRIPILLLVVAQLRFVLLLLFMLTCSGLGHE